MGNEHKIIGFVFARGGSKGVPRKNIRLLCGKPLIHYAIQAGLESHLIDEVIVSTENDEIAAIAKSSGASLPFMRPMELATDTSPEWLSWQHAIKQVQAKRDFDIFVSIPTTSPLRKTEDIDSCITALMEDDKADMVITVREAQRHPSFNMVVLASGGYAKIAFPESKSVSRRQDAKTLYDVTTVAYAARPEFILNSKAMFEGNIRTVIIPQERALDIDTEFDLSLAELLLKKRRYPYDD